ncbi:hypothetical protein N7535_001189 [Penicillium sp. DV-2018c]|nr:hypothetical protein N7461_005570 [Penicillium sp. DV-2018c]KAJ5582569.1 hypothetical protein N7535_001189 [Penicillium sp. DV-2018c]
MIPWDKVAQALGPEFTEEAILQRLADLQNNRENKPVPPITRRAVTAARTKKEENIKKKPTTSPSRSAGKREREPSTEQDSDENLLVWCKRRQRKP